MKVLCGSCQARHAQWRDQRSLSSTLFITQEKPNVVSDYLHRYRKSCIIDCAWHPFSYNPQHLDSASLERSTFANMGLHEEYPASKADSGPIDVKKQKRVAFVSIEVREEVSARPETIRVQTWPRTAADKSREIELDVEPNIHRPKGKVVEQGGALSYVTEMFFYMRNFNFFPLQHY